MAIADCPDEVRLRVREQLMQGASQTMSPVYSRRSRSLPW